MILDQMLLKKSNFWCKMTKIVKLSQKIGNGETSWLLNKMFTKR